MARNDRSIRELEEFRKNILTLPKVRKDLSKRMAKETLRFIRQQFATGTNPYGKAWARKKVPDGRKTLHGKTGKLRKFRVTRFGDHGFAVGTNADHFRYVNFGTKNMRRRQITVEPGEQLPAKWLSAYRTISLHLFRKHFKR